tara:strand:- start:1711 stop:1842 length:132 start_codon:yes stop_codon:yes gene_type:complete
MKLLKYVFGIVIIALIIAFAFFAIIDVPVQQEDVRVPVQIESE